MPLKSNFEVRLVPSGQSKKNKHLQFHVLATRLIYKSTVYKRPMNSLVFFRHKDLFLLSCVSGYIFRHSQRQQFVKV